MSDINIEELKKEFGKFKNIPNELFDYLINALNKNISDRYTDRILSEKRIYTLAAIDDMFVKAAKACQLSPKEIITGLDFNSKDCGSGRIEAFFAELRTINGLTQFGFTDINPLRAYNKKRSDITAKYNSNKYAVEVFHSPSQYTRWPDHKIPKNDFNKYYLNKASEKKAQLDTTAKELHCSKRLLVCVVDSKNIKELNTKNAFRDILKRIYHDLNWGPNYYYGIITGMVDLSGQADDVIYPSI